MDGGAIVRLGRDRPVDRRLARVAAPARRREQQVLDRIDALARPEPFLGGGAALRGEHEEGIANLVPRRGIPAGDFEAPLAWLLHPDAILSCVGRLDVIRVSRAVHIAASKRLA